MADTPYHKPVLVEEVLQYLNPQPGGIYVDATFGGGGHSRAILEHEPKCNVIAIDWDKAALELNAKPLEDQFGDRFKALWGNFLHLPKLLEKEKINKINGLLADFGTSQYQIKQQAGFSFGQDSFLDMRMSPAHQRFTAYDLINKATQTELDFIFREYGEERHSRAIAKLIVDTRRRHRIRTTKELADLVSQIVKRKPGQKIHPATKIFQAIRVAVNQELENIKAILSHSVKLLASGGRLVCISFHSLEDRIVKRFLREHEHDFNILTQKVVMASQKEIKLNPSSRSARLRAAERCDCQVIDKIINGT